MVPAVGAGVAPQQVRERVPFIGGLCVVPCRAVVVREPFARPAS